MNHNTPPNTNHTHPYPNYVIINHPHHHYTLLPHLNTHSITLHQPHLIYPQQLIPHSPNSRNSTQPHLHFQLINPPHFQNPQSFNIQFKHYNNPIKPQILKNHSSK
ncbi:peptidoglycan DD-metalloendopeptidase family protein, partial [Staphylococcus capitis]|uniref:peptidoglycan DD-metalloendopeptidase family protein n=1 Tax=Staphylococcus capitis TaxID=29388 RepID=UPI00370981A8